MNTLKVKVKSIYAIICLITVVFFCILACDNGSVSDSVANSNSLVKVSLTVDENTSSGLQKGISINSDIDLNSLTYQYSAEPLWTGTNIQGATNGFVTIVYDAGMSIGYFTSGLWQFDVQILKGGTIIYTGSTNVNISSGNVAVNVLVSKMVNQNPPAGSVRINVTAPTVNGESLSISYTGGSTITISDDDVADVDFISWSNGITTFDYTVNPLPVGLYTFTLTHPAGGSGATVAVDLRPGEGVVIEGHLDNGVWQVGTITVKIHTITLNTSGCEVQINVPYAATGDKVAFHVIPYSEGASPDTLSVKDSADQDVGDLDYIGGSLYTFTMPDDDVVVKAIYSETNTGVKISYFQAFFKILYNRIPAGHGNLISFGYDDGPVTGEFFSVKNVKLWYDSDNKKICWNTANGKVNFQAGSMKDFFKDCTRLKNIDLRGFQTSEVTRMDGMFENCSNLTSVAFDTEQNANGKFVNFDTGVVTDMSSMFDGCAVLPSVDLAGFDTHSVGSMSKMFFKCYELTTVTFDNVRYDVESTDPKYRKFKNFDTSSVTDMSCMFAGWDAEVLHPMKLATIDVSGFDTKNVMDMQFMFYQCKEIEELDVSLWNTANVENMQYMFAGLNEGYGTNLNHLHLTKWNFSKVTTTNRMFDRCQSLSDLTFPATTNFDSLTTMTYMFSHCTALTPSVFKSIVATWTFAQNPLYSTGGIYGNSDTSMFGNHENSNSGSNKGKNYIFRNTMTKYGANFYNRYAEDYITADGIQLYIGGGNDNKYHRLTTAVTP